MNRAISILVAVAALAVSAAPVASAGSSKARVGGKMHLEDISLGVKPKPKPTKARVGGKMHLEDISLGVKLNTFGGNDTLR